MAEKKRILVVDDNAKNLEDAVAVVEAAGHIVITAMSCYEAERILYSSEKVDGVLTDVYIPLVAERQWNHSESPCGLNVAASAKYKNIPCVLCTDDNHHGAKVQWLKSLIETEIFNLPKLVGGNGLGKSKNWERALELLFS